MKSFSVYIVKLLLLLIIISYGLEPVLDYGLYNLEGSVYDEWNKITKGEINADLIVMGSSRGMVSYDPNIISNQLDTKCFNLSFDAASYNLQQAKLNAYLLNNKMPTIIIQNVDLTHFSSSDLIPWETQFITILDTPEVQEIYEEVPGVLERYTYAGVAKYSLDSRKIKLGISNLLGLNPEYLLKKNGYQAVDKSYEEDSNNIHRLKEIYSNNSIENLDIFEVMRYYSDKRFDQTKVYFVWAPEYSTRRVLTIERSMAAKDLIKSDVSDELNKVFIDFQHDSIGQYSNYFYDSFHLNRKGSKIFTKKLVSIIKECQNAI